MPQSHGQEEQPITPTTTFDSSFSLDTQEVVDQSSARHGDSVLQQEALLTLLTSSNSGLNEALEGIHRMRGVEDGAAGRETGTRRARGHNTPDIVGRLDGEMETVGPSHSAIILSPPETSALEHLNSAMGDLIAGIPGHANNAAPNELNWSADHGPIRPIRIAASRQRSRSNVETQTSTQAQALTQSRTPPQRPSRDESTFYANMMGRRTVVLSRNDRRPGRSEDVASTTLGRRVAARAALGQTSTNSRPQPMRSPFRPITRDPRSSVAFPGNSNGNRGENVNHSFDSRTTSTDEDTELPRLLFGNITSDEEQDDENSDTETDEDLRLRRRILALSSAANQHERRLNNMSTSMDSYGSHSRLSSFPAVRGTYDSARSMNSDVNLPMPPPVAQTTSQTGSQTEDIYLPRSPSPSISDGGGPFHEVVETVQSLRGTYQVRRHVNVRGEEQVHQLRDDLWESSLFVPTAASIPRRSPAVDRRLSESWDSILRNRERLRVRNAERVGSNQNASLRMRPAVQFPAAPPSGPGFLPVPPRPSASGSSSSSSSTAARRRGWARLNADGDEVPTDEEEEIERVRTEQRLRSGDAVFTAPAASTSTIRTRLEYLTPTTRSVFNYGLEDEDAAPNPNIPARVRLNLPATQAHRRVQQLASEAILQKSSENASSGDRYFGTDAPYRISPLPYTLPNSTSTTIPSVLPERKFVTRQSEFAAR